MNDVFSNMQSSKLLNGPNKSRPKHVLSRISQKMITNFLKLVEKMYNIKVILFDKIILLKLGAKRIIKLFIHSSYTQTKASISDYFNEASATFPDPFSMFKSQGLITPNKN